MAGLFSSTLENFSMKKTLIALAALSAVGAASAQATLSGVIGFGFQSYYNDAAGTGDGSSKGFNMTDGEFTLTATEDLGGGLKITAKTTLVASGRQTAPATKDATLTLSGGFGTLVMGSLEHANINDNAVATGGSPVDSTTDSDDVVMSSSAATADTIVYVTPGMSGFNGILIYADDIGADVPGAGSGTLQAVLIGGVYNAGPLSARIDYATFDNDAGADFDRTRLQASYDFGSFKIGAGWEDRDTAAGRASDGQYIIGVSAPVGSNLTVGALYASDDATDADYFGLGLDYALSKRTVLNASWASIDDGVTDGDEFSVKLTHSF